MFETFHAWLIGDMGTPGSYQYHAIHYYTLAAVIILWAVVMLLVAISLFQLGFEVLWRLIYVFVKGDSVLCWWPLYPCNLGGILLPIFALCNTRLGKQMFYVFGFVGGVLTFALPDGIFSSDVLVFPILKSILQHTGLLLIPSLELACGSYRPTLRAGSPAAA